MSLLLNDIHLPLLIKSTLAEHAQYKTLPWNNLDQLSSLWGVFTKCKKNIRDGFRLENLSWRLWYRQSVLQKKVEPKTSEDIDFGSTATTAVNKLTRSRSLPNLSQWSQQKNLLDTPRVASQPQSQQQKFFIPPTFEEEEEEQEEEEEEPIMIVKRPKLTFTKKKDIATPTTNNSLLPKPVSLLTDMLQRTTSSKESSSGSSSGLRRCQSRYCRLDQFFLNAV